MKPHLLLIGCIVSGLACVGRADQQTTNGKLSLGDAIPAVSAPDQDGKTIDLAEAAKAGYTVVYFYPKAMTPGCTAQACSLRDAYLDLQQKRVKIFGVSADSVAKQKEFAAKDNLPFELLSDPDHKVMAAFGVPLIGPGLATRQAYLFKDGKLIWFDTKASTDKQAADIEAALGSSGKT
jgi:thioredoxin-dependent peroxiredoxin